MIPMCNSSNNISISNVNDQIINLSEYSSDDSGIRCLNNQNMDENYRNNQIISTNTKTLEFKSTYI